MEELFKALRFLLKNDNFKYLAEYVEDLLNEVVCEDASKSFCHRRALKVPLHIEVL